MLAGSVHCGNKMISFNEGTFAQKYYGMAPM